MIFIARILLSLFLAAGAAWCLFGLAATFEPLPAATQWTWRAIYALSFLAALAALRWAWRKPG